VWNGQSGPTLEPDERWKAGYFHKTWNASAPPPNPILNTSVGYNYTDNPSRVVAAPGDNKITLAWDNSSQISPDPGEIRQIKNVFDFRGYRIYKVAGWTRPVGSPGPGEDEWSLAASFTLFDYRDAGGRLIANNAIGKKAAPSGGDPGDTLLYPKVWIPELRDSLEIRLERGDLWDRQSGQILRPDRSLPCVKAAGDPCDREGCEAKCGQSLFVTSIAETLIHYPVGLYRFEDREVKNGFLYFYSVTAFDSSFDGMTEGRKSAVEAEGVVPQAGIQKGQGVWVVPNPYKGYQRIADRPSSWDLTPNAADPTGTHIDFMGLPAGPWTIRVFTVAGDLVAEIRSTDPVNESLRSPQTLPGTTTTLPGYNRQQDAANDGQARWNLISRNGQDIVSGIYLFTVDSGQGTQRGKFIVIR
jgi:hypothetical protein